MPDTVGRKGGLEVIASCQGVEDCECAGITFDTECPGGRLMALVFGFEKWEEGFYVCGKCANRILDDPDEQRFE
jgi:hypothetical protein